MISVIEIKVFFCVVLITWREAPSSTGRLVTGSGGMGLMQKTSDLKHSQPKNSSENSHLFVLMLPPFIPTHEGKFSLYT